MGNIVVLRKKTIPNLKTKFIKKHGKKTYDGLFRIWTVLGTVTTTWGYSKAMMESEIKFFTKEAKNAGYPKDIIPEFIKIWV